MWIWIRAAAWRWTVRLRANDGPTFKAVDEWWYRARRHCDDLKRLGQIDQATHQRYVGLINRAGKPSPEAVSKFLECVGGKVYSRLFDNWRDDR